MYSLVGKCIRGFEIETTEITGFLDKDNALFLWTHHEAYVEIVWTK